MADEISAKSTKNEILEAYQNALAALKEVKQPSKQELKIIEDKKATIAEATHHSTDDIVKQMSTLKFTLVRTLEEIEEQLLSRHKQLMVLQQAVEFQNKELSELHDIKVNADSLAALLRAQEDKTTLFNQEMTQKRILWKKEQDEFELSHNEREVQIQKGRQREEEEYVYQRNLMRQKEQDVYLREKESLEKELAIRRESLEQEFSSREIAISAQEQELMTLRQKSSQFPEELQKAVQDATNALTEKLTFKFDYETKLASKEVEGERKLAQQMIAGLEAKVAHFEVQIKQLSEKTNQANLQVQDIAVKALESASAQRFMPAYDKVMEPQTKQ